MEVTILSTWRETLEDRRKEGIIEDYVESFIARQQGDRRDALRPLGHCFFLYLFM